MTHIIPPISPVSPSEGPESYLKEATIDPIEAISLPPADVTEEAPGESCFASVIPAGVLERSGAKSIENLRHLPLMERLLEHLGVVIPLMREIITLGKRAHAETIELLKDHMNSEIDGNTLIGVIQLFGGMGGAVGGMAMKPLGEGIAALTQVGTTFMQGGQIKAQREFQIDNLGLEEIRKIMEQAERVQEKAADAVARTDQAWQVRM